MLDKYKEKAKACCSKEHERLLKNLEVCDRTYSASSEHQRCYQIAARRAGRRSKKCIIGG